MHTKLSVVGGNIARNSLLPDSKSSCHDFTRLQVERFNTLKRHIILDGCSREHIINSENT